MPFLIFAVAALLVSLGIFAVYVTLPRQRKASTPWRWHYVGLPLGVFLLSAIGTIYFFPGLPDQVAWRFGFDGTPRSWLGREALVAIGLSLQFVLAAVAIGITAAVLRLAKAMKKIGRELDNVAGTLPLIGSMVVLPQILLSFAMLDVFGYNAYQVHVMPLWAFALTVVGIGSAILIVFFLNFIRRARQTAKEK